MNARALVNHIYLSVASNIDPEENVFQAALQLAEFCSIRGVSRCFKTAAIPDPGSSPTISGLPHYINCVVLVQTRYTAPAFKFDVLRPIEAGLGRVRTADKYANRTIDLDILLCNDDVVGTPELEIPDPDITRRWFLMAGILDIDPDLTLPLDSQPLRIHFQKLLDQEPGRRLSVTEDPALKAKIAALVTDVQRA